MDCLLYYNPDEEGLPVRPALARAADAMKLGFETPATPEQCCDCLARASVAVIHREPLVRDEKPRIYAGYDWMCKSESATAAGLVVVFISSATIPWANRLISIQTPDNDSRQMRYVLGVRNTTARELAIIGPVDQARAVARWCELLGAVLDRDALESWLLHPDESNGHTSLDEFFAEKAHVEMLPALAILCQGYLALHAVWDEDQKEWRPQGIVPALRQMGWDKMMSGDPRINVLLVDQDKKKDEASGRDWWLNIFGFSHVDDQVGDANWRLFEESLRKEWGGGESLPPNLCQFLIALQEHGKIESPELVAKAYCELAQKLGGQPCPSS